MSMNRNHDNVVALVSSDITRVAYVEDSFHITTGQPFSTPPTITNDVANHIITISCGRSSSSDVADRFNTAVVSPNHSWCAPYSSLPSPVSTVKPSELNFFFAVDVTFTHVSTPVRVYLGQGSQVHLFNNWWIGGSAVLNTYPSYSLMNFFYVSSSKIYAVRAGDTSGNDQLANTFRFV